MKMNKAKIIGIGTIFVTIIMALCPMGFALNLEKQIPETQKTTINTTDLDIEILEISYNGWKITATIKNHGTSGARTIPIDFSVAYFIGDTLTNQIFIGEVLRGIKGGETLDVTKNWFGRGHFILYVEVIGQDQASKEMWYPKSKTVLFHFPLLENIFQHSIFYKLLYI